MTTREASIKWYEHTYPKAFANGVKEELILEEWLQEVVLPYIKSSILNPIDSRTDEEWGLYYLKEHEEKEEQDVCLPISETLDQKCLRTFNNMYFVDGDPDKYFIRSTIGAHEFKYALKLGSDIGSEWQKGKDKALIQSLLDALESFNESGFIWKDFTPEFKKEVRSAITKANQFLNS